jgi:hypothetical protein
MRLGLVAEGGGMDRDDYEWLENERELIRLELEIASLRRDNARLVAQLDEARAQAEANWECVEDVAIGAKLECPICKKSMPCLCDKS